VDGLGLQEGAGGVVDQYGAVVAEGGEARLNGIGARGSACYRYPAGQAAQSRLSAFFGSFGQNDHQR